MCVEVRLSRILCVDDEAGAAGLKRAILERAGYDVTVCTAAPEAIALLLTDTFDAVVTDWKLGEDSGREVLVAARAQSHVPVVVVSGYCAEAFTAVEPQADIYLEKPVDPEELVTIVSALLASPGKASPGA